MEYLTAKQTLGKLKQGRVTDISEAYFSQLVSMGAIPFHMIPGKKRKHYLYVEVKEALANIQDPSRDTQREANAEKRKFNRIAKERDEINTNYASAMDLLKITSIQLEERTNYKGDVLEEAKRELEEVQSVNLALSELVHEQKEAIKLLPFKAETIDFITHQMLKLTVEKMMTIDDFYSFIVGMDE